MRCQTCSYEHEVNDDGHILKGMNRGPVPFYKLEFDVSMKGEELSNKSSTLGSDNKRGPRRDFVTLYFCPKCGMVQARYSDPDSTIVHDAGFTDKDRKKERKELKEQTADMENEGGNIMLENREVNP